MNPAIFDRPLFEITLPIVVTIPIAVLAAMWQANQISKRIDDLRDHLGRRIDDLRQDTNRQFAEVNKRLDRIEAKLDNHETRLIALEERTPQLGR